MAAISMNATQVRQFDRGGRLIFVTSADTITINNKISGTLEISDGGTEPVEFKEAGVPQAPLMGDQAYSEIKIKCRYTYDSSAAVQDLMNFIRTAGTTGLIPTFTMNIDEPQYKGVTNNWHRDSYASSFFVASGCRLVGGTDYDTIELTVRSATPKPTESIVTS